MHSTEHIKRAENYLHQLEYSYVAYPGDEVKPMSDEQWARYSTLASLHMSLATLKQRQEQKG